MSNQRYKDTSPSGRMGEITAIVLLTVGVVMAFIALFLPPPGEIHDSVLYIFAQILIYAGSIFGIDAYIGKRIDSNKNRRLSEKTHQIR